MSLITLGLVDRSLISIGLGSNEQQVVIEIVQSQSSSSKYKFDFEDDFDSVVNYLKDNIIYLSKTANNYLISDIIKLVENRRSMLQVEKNIFLKDSKSKFAREKPHYIS